MTEQIIIVHNSKLTYATIKKMIQLIGEYSNLKEVLLYYFPQLIVNSIEWRSIKNNCESFLQKNTNWFGISPGSVNAGQTTTVTSNSLNESSVLNLYNKLLPLVTFSSTPDYTDIQIWTEILNKILEMYNIDKEYTMHMQVFNDIKDIDGTQTKTPEQLSVYNNCEFPLPTNTQAPEKANYYAFREVLSDDSYYSELPIYDIDSLITDQGFDKIINSNVSKVITTSSTYQHTDTVGYVIKATTIADGTNLPNITYTDHDTVVIGDYTSATELRLIELSPTISVPTSGVPIIETPIIISPDGGIGIYNPITFTSTSFAVSGSSFDLHTKSHWEVASDAGFTTVVHSSLNDNINLVSYEWDPSTTLSTSSTYYWRVKYTGAQYGDSLWSAGGDFSTPSSWDCTLGGLIGGGISAGETQGNCIIVAKSDSEPTGTNAFDITANETAQLALTGGLGDFTYRSDLDKYYLNTTGSNTTMSDWQEVIPQDEPNDDLYVSSEVAQLALTVVIGNISVRTDTNECFVNITGNNTSMADWQEVDVSVKIWWLAKQYCLDLSYNGYTDWYLPTASELNLIYDNLITIDTSDGTGNFTTWWYYTSTADIIDQKFNSWAQNFNTGVQSNYDRDTKWFYVRPVRRL